MINEYVEDWEIFDLIEDWYADSNLVAVRWMLKWLPKETKDEMLKDFIKDFDLEDQVQDLAQRNFAKAKGF